MLKAAITYQIRNLQVFQGRTPTPLTFLSTTQQAYEQSVSNLSMFGKMFNDSTTVVCESVRFGGQRQMSFPTGYLHRYVAVRRYTLYYMHITASRSTVASRTFIERNRWF